ncbi:hypothetical protein BDN72DRAFT_842438 [Pluteus cervinus]|uniref:Uncharacterized protein n=1 Tax=Pluteus cervinus TaxID=181527 RepID=A0ACD3AQK2_9AGAR|nr:hypothetical protein BDN72DRAFT_842438 [Pluteus cervinus]
METEGPLERPDTTHRSTHENHFPRSSPTHRLPPEILTTIFIYFRRIAFDDYPPDSQEHCAPWMVVTEVCSHWRNVAHESTILWSHIPRSYTRRIIERCLKFSKSAPLVVKIHGCMTSDQIHPSLMDPGVISRLRCLDLNLYRLDSASCLEELCSHLSSAAPSLESLSIDLNQFRVQSGPRYLDEIWARAIPRLRNLSLRACDVNLSSPLLTNLTILEIRNPEPKLNGVELISTLHGLPSLMSLQMSDVLRLPENYKIDPSYTPIFKMEVVELPSLRLLSIHGFCYAQDLDLLSCLSFPSTTTVLFSSGYPFHHPSPITAVSDLLKIHASARLDFGAFTPTKIELMTFCGRLKLNLVDDRKTLCAFKLDSDGEDTRYERHEISPDPDLDEMLPYLSFPTITHFSTSWDVIPSAWPIISSALPRVKTLSVEGMCRPEVATIFKTLINDSQTRSSSPWMPIFPRLQTLHLQDITIDDECKEQLVRVLQDRKGVGSGLEKIGVDGCDQIDDEFLDCLGVVEGLSVTRCRCDGMTEEERDLEMNFAEDLDRGEISCSDVDPRYHVRRYMEDDDM